MGTQSLSIHAHFYQPPREDPITGRIPIEVGANPFQNWNERIHAECYRPNAELRNFEQISFNIGPTLLAWMDHHDPQTVARIVAQDAANLRRNGVGNAIAQGYNHTILPLSSRADKITQVAWGCAEFRHRFGRDPQGLWLPETAVDLETLEVLEQAGLRFTILAPWQAGVRGQSGGGVVDPTEPYRVDLPNGRRFTVFFYQQDLSTRISFDPSATVNADDFARYVLLSYYNPEKTRRGEPQLILAASDGELYGHHQHLRDRFLARLMDGAVSPLDLHKTYPALWLQQHPPRQTITIREDTSWSCHHGVLRWKTACGCTPGDSAWKTNLRLALEHLAEALDDVAKEVLRPLFSDPLELRNRYIHVILGEMTAEQLIAELAGRALTGEQTHRVHLLLEAQRERQRMFTSCGWFFEDFDRIEPRNNVAYAAQAVLLTLQATGIDLSGMALRDLALVRSPRSGLTAERVFLRHMERACSAPGEHVGFAD